MYLPLTPKELARKGASRPDVILVSGDTYIDSPYCGVAVVGRVLEEAGYSVALVTQPDVEGSRDIAAFGEPRLFWGVSAGCVDSEVANYTALGKPRRQCDFTPGGRNTRRPDRASIVYTNLIRRHFKNTAPIVLGGLEASLRRIAHYDFRSGRVRRSLLFDAKADLLIYGMGEQAVLALAGNLERGDGIGDIPGSCVVADSPPQGYATLPSFESVRGDRLAFAEMYSSFYRLASDPGSPGLVQPHGDKHLVHHPPQPMMSRQELDRIHELPFRHEAHPDCRRQGEIRALETIRDSLITHRGCYGECSFCAIALHQGRSVISRSTESILREAEGLAERKGFSGTIKDVGGPTANMYASGCSRLRRGRPCTDRHCIGHHGVCSRLEPGHAEQMRLLRRLESVPGVERVFVSSGVRHDLVLADRQYGRAYLEQLAARHISGQLKIAPEHSVDSVLELMNKPPVSTVSEFLALLRKTARRKGLSPHLSCYVIAAHPGSREKDMQRFLDFARSELRFIPRQVQIFVPLPSTRSTAMYHCGLDPFSGREVSCVRSVAGKSKQKQVLLSGPKNKRRGGKRKSGT
jgi:uncharacterized radical SAM protein YgiQ